MAPYCLKFLLFLAICIYATEACKMTCHRRKNDLCCVRHTTKESETSPDIRPGGSPLLMMKTMGSRNGDLGKYKIDDSLSSSIGTQSIGKRQHTSPCGWGLRAGGK